MLTTNERANFPYKIMDSYLQGVSDRAELKRFLPSSADPNQVRDIKMDAARIATASSRPRYRAMGTLCKGKISNSKTNEINDGLAANGLRQPHLTPLPRSPTYLGCSWGARTTGGQWFLPAYFGATIRTSAIRYSRDPDQRFAGHASFIALLILPDKISSAGLRMISSLRISFLSSLALFGLAFCVRAAGPVLVPQIDGDFWQVAGDPDLGPYTAAKQQPVDFGIWQAADGTWQLWSCIRSTATPGKTRLFYRWQGKNLTDKNWLPMGISMMADSNFGETEGGLQAPFVLKEDSVYNLFYGNWEQIALAKGVDGKTFARQLTPEGVSGMFSEGTGNNTRDPMVLKIGSVYYCYYTAYPDRHGAVFVRTSKDKLHWSAPQRVSYGGSPGDGPFSAECPFVYYHKASGYYYLLRNQFYGEHARFTVYRSKNPLDFGKDSDQYLVETMPYAAPEIIESNGQPYLAVLLPSLKGIQIAKLKFAVQSDLKH